MKNPDLRALAWLKKHRVAVLKGGWSRERAVSLRTGQAVEAAFRRMGVRFRSIDVRPDILARLIHEKPDFAFLALHGPFGEDGRIQSCLDILNIVYTGSGPTASALAMDKDLSKRLFVERGVPTPPWVTIQRSEHERNPTLAREKTHTLLKKGPVFVKPVDQGSAIGAARVDRASGLEKALSASFAVSTGAIVERYIKGRELTVGVLDGSVLPVVEILPAHTFYDYHSKYAKGGSRHLVPAALSGPVRRRAENLSLAAMDALGCSVYGRVDLLLSPDERLTVLEVNTIPGMTATSLLPDAARATGIDFDSLVLRIVSASLTARSRGRS